jgi:FkbM family methyltransferase
MQSISYVRGKVCVTKSSMDFAQHSFEFKKDTPNVRFWEFASIKFLFRCCKASKGQIVDVGAQVGSFTLLAKFLNAPFLAIEADKEAAKHLEDNLLANGLILGRDLNLLVGAASSSDGIAILKVDSNHRGLSNIGVTQYRMIPDRKKQVKTYMLDNFDLGPVSAIKMDIEG